MLQLCAPEEVGGVISLRAVSLYGGGCTDAYEHNIHELQMLVGTTEVSWNVKDTEGRGVRVEVTGYTAVEGGGFGHLVGWYHTQNLTGRKFRKT